MDSLEKVLGVIRYWVVVYLCILVVLMWFVLRVVDWCVDLDNLLELVEIFVGFDYLVCLVDYCCFVFGGEMIFGGNMCKSIFDFLIFFGGESVVLFLV